MLKIYFRVHVWHVSDENKTPNKILAFGKRCIPITRRDLRARLMPMLKKFTYWKFSPTAGLTHLKQFTDSIKYLKKNTNFLLTESEVFTGKYQTETLPY